jgi:hypothetical protein
LQSRSAVAVEAGTEAAVAVVSHRLVAIVVGELPPAMSISWRRPAWPGDSGYVVFFSEFDPDSDDDQTPDGLVCLDCLVNDGDA